MDIRYSKAQALPGPEGDSRIDMVDLFSQLFLRSNGNVQDTLDWIRQLGERYGFINRDRTFEDVLDELEEKGVIQRDRGELSVTQQGERAIRDTVFERVFGGLGKSLKGGHATSRLGPGGDRLPECRPFQFGDAMADINLNDTLHNYLKRRLNESLAEAAMTKGGSASLGTDAPVEGISENDFAVHDTENTSNCATVLMLDISHSMILYGEDRITPAKMVAISLVEFIRRKYPRDSIDVITFGDEAVEIAPDRIAHVSVGPFHTNTCDALKLAQTILRRRQSANKQIFMVTDGKPSAVFDRGRLYKNSFGLDPLVLAKTYAEARACRKSKIRICTFMIAKDPYLIEFIESFTRICAGKAFYTGLGNLGEFIFVDYAANRRSRVK